MPSSSRHSPLAARRTPLPPPPQVLCLSRTSAAPLAGLPADMRHSPLLTWASADALRPETYRPMLPGADAVIVSIGARAFAARRSRSIAPAPASASASASAPGHCACPACGASTPPGPDTAPGLPASRLPGGSPPVPGAGYAYQLRMNGDSNAIPAQEAAAAGVPQARRGRA